MKLGIYYIATSNYKMGFEHFRKNIHLFAPHLEKEVVVLSDGLEEWNDKEENGVKYKVHYIRHHVWPIITLFKMKYILDFKDNSYDYVCYFNGNLQYNPQYRIYFDWEKLNVSRHTFSDANDKYDGNKFESVSKDSVAYIDKYYQYIHGGLFFGKASIVYKMCEDVSNMVEIDLKNNIIPQWHDESYLNKWCVENEHLVAPKRKLIAYQEFNIDYPFSIIETILKDRRL